MYYNALMPDSLNYNHSAFSDDSSHQGGRYNSLGLLTLPLWYEETLRRELLAIFCESNIKMEFKWQKVRSARYKFAAKKIHDWLFRNLSSIRLDILIWDMEDARHLVFGRDDNANIVRMYYHLLQSTLSKRWSEGAYWIWKPDYQSCISWSDMKNFLVTKKHSLTADLFKVSKDDFWKLNLECIKPTDSSEEVFLQVIDYFTGLGAYSWGHYVRFNQWVQTQSGQGSLFDNNDNMINFTNSESIRFDLLSEFHIKCKASKMTVSLDKTNGLLTNDPSKPINFWFYTPQHELDKAPIKL